MKKYVFLLMFLLIGVQAFAVSWDDPYFTVGIRDWENPVWVKDVKANTIYTYYKAMFGPGEVKLLSPLPGNPTGYLSDENRTFYGHRAYLGYVMALTPSSNLGVWTTDTFRITDGDGEIAHLFASGNYYIQDTRTEALSNREDLDVVYTRDLSSTLTFGLGLNYNNNDFIYDADYTTTSFLGVGPRNLDFTSRKNANYFGSSVGLAYTPTSSFSINFGLEGGGFFGTRHYEESRYNYVGTLETGHFNHDGNYEGYDLKAEADGHYRINSYWRIPFRVSYSYGHEWDAYEGLGNFAPANVPYYREDDREYRYNQAKVKVGVEYFPKGNWDVIIPLFLGYTFDNDKYGENLVTDYTSLGGDLNDRFTDTTYNNHTLGVSTGVVFTLIPDLKMSTMLRYSYTFVNTTARADINTNGVLVSTSTITEPGHMQDLDGIIGFTYSKTLAGSHALTVDLFGTIPILSEADYTAGVPDSDDNFPQGSVRETSFSREYSIFLGISYSF
jgi:hypothetical protein